MGPAYSLVMDGAESGFWSIAVRTGNGRMVQPTIKGGPIDQRPGSARRATDGSIRIGGHQGSTSPPLSDPSVGPPNDPPTWAAHRAMRSARPKTTFEVYRGRVRNHPLDSAPVWRYIAKDCLREPGVAAVEEFRKAIAKAEQPQPAKKP